MALLPSILFSCSLPPRHKSHWNEWLHLHPIVPFLLPRKCAWHCGGMPSHKQGVSWLEIKVCTMISMMIWMMKWLANKVNYTLLDLRPKWRRLEWPCVLNAEQCPMSVPWGNQQWLEQWRANSSASQAQKREPGLVFSFILRCSGTRQQFLSIHNLL